MEITIFFHGQKSEILTYIFIGDTMTKYKVGMIILLLLCLCSFNFVSAKEKPKELNGKVIYLDPGHPEYSYTQDNEK